jgi:hypothetical protein
MGFLYCCQVVGSCYVAPGCRSSGVTTRVSTRSANGCAVKADECFIMIFLLKYMFYYDFFITKES